MKVKFEDPTFKRLEETDPTVVVNPVMGNAIKDHKRSKKNFEDVMDDRSKDVEDVSEKKDSPKKVELPKTSLDESLFEDFDNDEEEFDEVRWNKYQDLKSDLYNAVANLLFKKYRDVHFTEEDLEDAWEWFITHYTDDDRFEESLTEDLDNEVVIGIYGGDDINIPFVKSVDDLVKYFEAKRITVSDVDGDFESGWEMNLHGDPQDIFFAVCGGKIPGYNSKSVQEFVDQYRIDESLTESITANARNWLVDKCNKSPKEAEKILNNSTPEEIEKLALKWTKSGGKFLDEAFKPLSKEKILDIILDENSFIKYIAEDMLDELFPDKYPEDTTTWDDVSEEDLREVYLAIIEDEDDYMRSLAKNIENNLPDLFSDLSHYNEEDLKKLQLDDLYDKLISLIINNNYKINRYKYKKYSEDLKEDTIKTKSGKWVNKGDTGKTHGTFKTKKAADAQRKAMFASGYKAEELNEGRREYGEDLWSAVYDELAFYNPNIKKISKFPEVQRKDRYSEDLIDIDANSYILVYAKDLAGLDFAHKVANAYKVEYEDRNSPIAFAAHHPNKAVYCLLKVTEDLQFPEESEEDVDEVVDAVLGEE